MLVLVEWQKFAFFNFEKTDNKTLVLRDKKWYGIDSYWYDSNPNTAHVWFILDYVYYFIKPNLT